MLCYFFPPLAGGGVQRSTKFVKYLCRLGWDPTVISVRPNSRNRIEQGLDHSLLGDIPSSVQVVRCRSLERSYLYGLLHRLRLRRVLFEIERALPLLHMDYKTGWFPFALRSARREVRAQAFQLVYTTSSPYASHFVGYILKRTEGLPWVADFRDPWTLSSAYNPPTSLHARFERWIEARLLASADAIIANTSINADELVCRFGVPSDRVHVIPNGFDPEDFETQPDTSDPSAGFTVSCVGKYHATSDPGRLFRAFARFSRDHPEARLKFWGQYSRGVRRAAELALGDLWQRKDRVEHHSAIQVMRSSSVLLANLPNAESGHWVPGKLYEYLASGIPILLIGPVEGAAADIIRTTRTGTIVADVEEEILGALEALFQGSLKNDSSERPSRSEVSTYDRRRQVKHLSEVFEGVASTGLQR